jgi:hypothetical protein
VEEAPRRLAAGDHVLDRLAERQPHEAVAAHHRREHQGVAHPAPADHRLGQQAHAAKVHLALVARLAVGDPDGGSSPAPANLAHLQRVAVQGPLRHHDPPTVQQVMNFAHRQLVLVQPVDDEAVVGDQQPPRPTVTVNAVGTHRLHHRTDELVSQLLLAASADQTPLDGRCHIATHGLAVESRQPLRRPDALATQPQPQHLSHLEHTHLPERHRRSP